MKEKQHLSLLLTSNIKKHLKNFQISKIEGSSSTGISDINLCVGGPDIWIELKIVIGQKIYLRPSQIAWSQARIATGKEASRRLNLIVRKNDTLYLMKTEDALLHGLSLRDIPKVWETSKPFDWIKLLDALVRSSE